MNCIFASNDFPKNRPHQFGLSNKEEARLQNNARDLIFFSGKELKRKNWIIYCRYDTIHGMSLDFEHQF